MELCGYFDSDWGGSENDAKSNTGNFLVLVLAFPHGIVRNKIWWLILLSKAEFVAAATAVNQALWLKKILVGLHMEPTGSIKGQ